MDRQTLDQLADEIRNMLTSNFRGSRLHLADVRRRIEDQSSVECGMDEVEQAIQQVCARACVCVCVRVRACACVCVRACASERACVCVSTRQSSSGEGVGARVRV